jgi:transposase
MATERLSMRKIREILRLKWVLGRSHREIARATGVGLGTVSEVAWRARTAGIDSWAVVETLDEPTLEARLYPSLAPTPGRTLPDPKYLAKELRRQGVTLRLLHAEYLEQRPGGYGYTHFCEAFRAWQKSRKLTMRQLHRAGDKVFIDYSGKKPSVVDPESGERVEVELFVAVLGASSYTYAEATRTQRVADFVSSHVRALEFFGGVPAALVPDQLRSAVGKPCRYEPSAQRTYEELAQHYNTTILPARPAKPRDKALVEVTVQVAQRWILARLRNRTFFSLEELNEAIAELLVDLNDRVMRRWGESRRQLFERLERPALKPLPSERFDYGEWKIDCGVNLDYHVDVNGHYYSVHYSLVHERVDARTGTTTVEIFHRGRRVAVHRRSYQRGGFTTLPEHMPALHKKHAEWTPERVARWAGTVGPMTRSLVEAIMDERRHPEHGYRSWLGLMRLGERYGRDRLEAAAQRAFLAGARSYKNVKSILERGLDRAPLPDSADGDAAPPVAHDNIRGPDYYH